MSDRRAAYAALPEFSCLGTLSIDGVEMQRAAWYVELSPLWRTPDVRGGDRILPGVTGVRPYRRRRTVSRYSLPMIVTGQYDRFGLVTPDPEAGLAANLAYLNANVLLPTNVGDGTRSATWVPPGQPAVVVDVHVLGISDPGFSPGALMRTTLELSVPRGDLHL